jgi:hypothetical protein
MDVAIITWRLWLALGVQHGVQGSCDDVCPCGSRGSCADIAADASYTCDCDSGYQFDGTTCATATTSSDTSSVSTCGGSTNRPCAEGFACQDDAMCIPGPAEADCSGTCIPVCSTLTGEGCAEGFACTVNPAVTCPAMPGYDCPGLCVQTCGGLVAGPSQQCPDGTSCADNPLQPNCTLAADCPGVCLPSPNPESCSTLTGEGCAEGYACAPDPDIACIALAGFDCPGQCMQTCGGLVAGPSQQCPEGTSCVDNPLQPNCTLAADCPGVCLTSPNPESCSTLTGEGCVEGYACAPDPDIACIALAGFDCPGQCVQTCGGLVAGPSQQCPEGTSCADNPLQPNCTLAADCPGVCLTSPSPESCSTLTGEGCAEGFACTINPAVTCPAIPGFDCPGQCVQT